MNDRTGEVVYTPPQDPDVIRRLLSNLADFYNGEATSLAHMAVLHYQFETIHPFLDGNGRTGRILNVLYLILKGYLEIPILYPSSYIIEHNAILPLSERGNRDRRMGGVDSVHARRHAANSDAVYIDWSKTGYRLPTEAEWEFAARYINGTDWNNGDHVSGDTEYACYEPDEAGPLSGSPLASDARIGEYAWWEGNNSGSAGDPTYGTKEVGRKTANDLGLHDMSGNVYEWCYDWYDTYSGESETHPTGPESGRMRVIRGGDWSLTGIFLRSADRYIYPPSDRHYGIGFRLCRTAD